MASEAEEKDARARVTHINVMAEANDDVCWICLDGPSLDRPLQHACRCPSWTHATCIARWQLQSAGTRREKYCDFCNSELPDWKAILTPSPGATAPAVMNVNFDNKTYSFQVAPGVDGYRQFTEAIRKAFHLPDDSELNITFTCDEPSSGNLLTLSGPGAYDAAVHCAAVSAARRSMSSDEEPVAGASQPHHAVFDSTTNRPEGAEGRAAIPQGLGQPGSSSSSTLAPPASSTTGRLLPDLALEAEPAAGGATSRPPTTISRAASSSSGCSSSSAGSSSSNTTTTTTTPRRGGNLGRKLRDALTELLISK
eukprot:gene1561-1901_t